MQRFKGFPRKVASQLSLLFMLIFFVTLSFSLIVIYSSVENTLRRNYESSNVARFEQSDYSIGMLLETVDLVSRRLVVDADLNSLFNYNHHSDLQRVSLCREALTQFNNIINNYPYICSVAYYSTEGLMLKASPRNNTMAYGEEVLEDWFFSSKLYATAQENHLNLYCVGGYAAQDFDIPVDTDVNPSGYYLCAVRNTRSREALGTLVINISMEHFYSVFNASNDGTATHSYIVDENATIIASADPTEIGQQTAFVLPPEQQHESLRLDTAEGWIEAVYYRTPVGVLVREDPVSVITGDIDKLRALLVLLFLGSLAIAYPLQRACVRHLTQPVRDLTTGFLGLAKGHLGIEIPVHPLRNELDDLSVRFNETSRAIKANFQKTLRHSEEKRHLEMQALRAQINPHFIYNTLNIIKWMAIIEHKNNIADCITVFSRFLQATLKEKNPLCTLETEINFLGDYVRILNYRFSGALSLQCDIPEDCKDLLVLRFLLQPLTENAVVHGLAEKIGGVIRITARLQGEELILEVTDNGVGFPPEKLAALQEQLRNPPPDALDHIGVLNVARRMRLQFGPQYGLQMDNPAQGGARIILNLPATREKDVL